MKLRHVLATAAAAAVIAPAALLTAPAAVASTTHIASTSTATPTAPGSAQGTPEAEETSASPAASGSTTPGASDDSSSSASTSPSGSASADASDTASASAGASATASTSASSSASSSPSASESPRPTAEPSDCPVDDNFEDLDSALQMNVSGLPGQIAAGSGWHTFTLSVANSSKSALGEVQWLAVVDNGEEKDALYEHAHLQFFNPSTNNWESIEDAVGTAGIFFGSTDLGARQTVDIKLRLDIDAKAPLGDGYSIGLGAYLDTEKNCYHTAYSEWDFTVLAPKAEPADDSEAKPSTDDNKAPAVNTPAGSTAQLPATGTLAETGASSSLQPLALAGGAAVILGGGAVFIVRRRKAGQSA